MSGPAQKEAVIGDDFLGDGDSHKTFGITIRNASIDRAGAPHDHRNMVEVYADEALRDRILQLLQTHGVEAQP